MKRLQASSLVLVVMVMAGIIIVVFGASRLTLVQFNQSNRDEDNIFALYAAKAGIEDGLLRFRYNRDAETGDGQVARYNLTTGANANEVLEGSPAPNAYKQTDQYYDMKLNFRGTQLGTFDTNTPLKVTKDSSLELTGFPNTTEQYHLRYWFEFTDCVGADDNRLVQIQQISGTTSSSQSVFEQTTVKKPSGASIVDSATNSINIPIRENFGSGKSLTSTIRLRPYGCSIKYALATTESTGAGGGVGPRFDNTKSTITSTGYFGAAQRTLIAEIDRASGQLISIYDFNLYAGTGNISP